MVHFTGLAKLHISHSLISRSLIIRKQHTPFIYSVSSVTVTMCRCFSKISDVSVRERMWENVDVCLHVDMCSCKYETKHIVCEYVWGFLQHVLYVICTLKKCIITATVTGVSICLSVWHSKSLRPCCIAWMLSNGTGGAGVSLVVNHLMGPPCLMTLDCPWVSCLTVHYGQHIWKKHIVHRHTTGLDIERNSVCCC